MERMSHAPSSMTAAPACPRDSLRGQSPLEALLELIDSHRRLFVLTGAGCSTGSGIPDYRDADGRWKHAKPVSHRAFVSSAAIRRRYWARSSVGWRRFAAAQPNAAHRALADLERRGRIACLVTQNVDGLHSAAGSREVIDLHGRLDRVECLGCGLGYSRHRLQDELERLNPGWSTAYEGERTTPDGDAELGEADYGRYRVPACPACGGVLKPAIVFFGGTIPAARKETAFAALDRAEALLVVGSSLMVMSGYRFALRARERGMPFAILNLGRGRADELATLRVARSCEEVLPELVALLDGAEGQRPSRGPARATRPEGILTDESSSERA